MCIPNNSTQLVIQLQLSNLTEISSVIKLRKEWSDQNSQSLTHRSPAGSLNDLENDCTKNHMYSFIFNLELALQLKYILPLHIYNYSLGYVELL
jgi:hypothetical protein